MKLKLISTALALAALGCGGGDDDGASSASPAPDAMVDDTPMEDTSTPADTMVMTDTAVPSTDTGSPTPTPVPQDAPVPTNAAALFAYLKAGGYKAFAHESAPHASTGPHGNVQVYINDTLESSLAAGAGQHPAGAAAVKELWSGSSLFGWAVMVKTAPSSAGGNNWYWFELFNTTDVSAALEGKGLPGCTGCHSLGRDYYRSPYPLE